MEDRNERGCCDRQPTESIVREFTRELAVVCLQAAKTLQDRPAYSSDDTFQIMHLANNAQILTALMKQDM